MALFKAGDIRFVGEADVDIIQALNESFLAPRIDIKILLFNNGYLGMVRQWQTLFYDGRYAGTPMKNPDFGSIAKAYGIPHRKVSRVEEIEEALTAAADHKGACMVEFLCDPSEIVLPMVPAGGGFADMIATVEIVAGLR